MNSNLNISKSLSMNNLAFFHVEYNVVGKTIYANDNLQLTYVYGTEDIFVAYNDEVIGKVSRMYGGNMVLKEHLAMSDKIIRKVCDMTEYIGIFSISSK